MTTIDHDRLFKELITNFFFEFIMLFIPEIAKDIEPDSIDLLDKEIFTDITAGEKHEADLVAKVKYRGQDFFFLIHIESQAQWQAQFARRMFRYFALLHNKYELPIYPIALLSFDKPRQQQPSTYQLALHNLNVLQFNYHVVQLNSMNWRNYLNQANPVASALMTRMDISPEDRPRVKLECLRLLTTLKLNPAKSHFISKFIDTYLRLNAEEIIRLRQELLTISPQEQESIMEFQTSWEEEGYYKGMHDGKKIGHQEGRQEGLQEGLQEGIQEGRQEGKREGELALITRWINRKFGPIEPILSQQLESLSLEQLELLADALIDLTDRTELINWLKRTQR